MDASRGTVTTVLMGAALLIGLLTFTWTALDLATYPYDLDYSEGFVLEDAKRFGSGGVLYPVPNLSNGFESVKYPPVHYVLLAGAAHITELSFPTARAINILATFLAVAILGLIVHRKTGKRSLLPLLFLAPFATLFTGITIRADMLALLFSLLGLHTFLGGRRYAAAGLFLIAFFTKQSFVAGIAAAVVSLSWRAEWRSILQVRSGQVLNEMRELRPALRLSLIYLLGLTAGILFCEVLLGAFLENVFLANVGGLEVRWDLLNWVHVSFLPLFGLAAYYVFLHRDVLIGVYFLVALSMMLLQMVRGGAWVYAAIQPAAAAVLAVSLLHARTPPIRIHIQGILLFQIGIFFLAPIVSGPLFAMHTIDDLNRESDQRIATLVEEHPSVYVEHIGYQLGTDQRSPEIWGMYEQYEAGRITADDVRSFFRQQNYTRIITYKRLQYLPLDRYRQQHYTMTETIERQDTLLHTERWHVYALKG